MPRLTRSNRSTGSGPMSCCGKPAQPADASATSKTPTRRHDRAPLRRRSAAVSNTSRPPLDPQRPCIMTPAPALTNRARLPPTYSQPQADTLGRAEGFPRFFGGWSTLRRGYSRRTLVELKQGFKLGSFEVRPLTGEVSGADGTAHLEPKVMEVLAALAQRPGDVVEREELLARVWGARAAVADEPLTRCIAELRRVLGDSRQTPVFIQTIPKRGYRLLCAVTPLAARAAAAPATLAQPEAEPAATDPRPAASRARRRATHPIALGGGFAAAIALGAIALWAMGRGAAESGATDAIARNTIAVLPFTDVGGSAESAYFGEGLADEILNRL